MKQKKSITVTPKTIVVCEPQCYGFEHAGFNATFLLTISLAYPSSVILFLAEESHIVYVKEELHIACGDLPPAIKFNSRAIPPRDKGNWRRFPYELRIMRIALNEARRSDTVLLFFCSITGQGLFALKILLYQRRPKYPVLAIPHSLIEITGAQPKRIWNWVFALNQSLRLPNPRFLRLIALGQSIFDEVMKWRPDTFGHWCIIDMPYLLKEQSYIGSNASDPLDEHLTFGFFGGTRKGFTRFCQIAEDLNLPNNIAKFILVGFYIPNENERLKPRWQGLLSTHPLSREDYDKLAREVTYAVWTAIPENYMHNSKDVQLIQDYSMGASLAFLDALCYVKPGIYIRSRYVEHYFGILGDIGYLCDSYADMKHIIAEITENFPEERYKVQCSNILAGRKIFEPATVAKDLRDEVEQTRQEQ